MYWSVNECTTFRWSFEEDACEYSRLGIPAMGVWRHKLSDYEIDAAAGIVRENRLRVSSVSWAGGFTGSDGRSFQESVMDARVAIQTAARLGTETVVVYTGSRGHHTLNHAHRLFKSAIDQLRPYAEEFGVRLAIKPVYPRSAEDFTFLDSTHRLLDLLDSLDTPVVRMAFDTYHLGWVPELLDGLKNLVPYIALVRLGDGRRPPSGEQDRCPLCTGAIPLRYIMEQLAEGGYRGFHEVYLLGESMEGMEYVALLRHVKEKVEQLSKWADAVPKDFSELGQPLESEPLFGTVSPRETGLAVEESADDS